MTPDDPRHGTPRGYRLHMDNGESACEDCALAWYRYNKRATHLRAVGTPLRLPSLGTHRRIRALMALGYGLPVLADRLGIATGNLSYKLQQPYVVRSTHQAVAELFEALSMAPPPAGWVAQRTRNIAAKRGWAPPLAWDDIDDPNEHPKGIGAPRGRLPDDVDPVIVDRLLLGQRVPSTRAEKFEAMRQWLASGRLERDLCAQHGWAEARYTPRAADRKAS